MIYFAVNDRFKWSFSLQTIAASGFAESVLFLLQVSYFAASDLLQVVELQVAKEVAASDFAANGLI